MPDNGYLTPAALDVPELPNPLPLKYMHSGDFTYPQMTYFGNAALSREPLYVLYADDWRLDDRPYEFEIDWKAGSQ